MRARGNAFFILAPVGLAFEKGHLQGVEENDRKDQCRKRVKKRERFTSLDDRVRFKSGGESNDQDEDAQKQGNGEGTQEREKDSERKNRKEEDAQDAFQDRCRSLIECVKKDPSPTSP